MLSRRRFFTNSSLALASLSLMKFQNSSAHTKELLDIPPAQDSYFWEKLRKQFVIPRDQVYFNNGTLGAQPRYVLETVTNHMRKCAEGIAEWDFSNKTEPLISGYGRYNRLRGKFARIINADISEVSLVQNATMGMNLAANGLNLEPGDEVLSTNQEHPGGKCGFELRAKRYGTTWRAVKIPVPANDPDEIVRLFDEAISPKTKVIAFSHISTIPCMIYPAKAICKLARERGILSVVDGAQSVGQIKVDVKEIGCDIYYGSPHKWMLAPAGNGFLYVRKGLAPKVWTTLASSAWDNDEDHGYRLQQRGTGNPSLLAGFEAAIDFHNAIGSERIFRRIKALGDRLRAGLLTIPNVHISSSVHPDMCAGMTVYSVEGLTGKEMEHEFWRKARMRPRGVGRKLGVRHCTHIYNSFEEIDKALEVVKGMGKTV